jgi:hypothetical protein
LVLAGSSPIPKNDGPTIPIGRIVEKRVCGIERIHNMDLKETTIALFGIDGMESLLKLRALVILAS